MGGIEEVEVVVPLEEFKRLAADSEKLTMLIDSLLNNAAYMPLSDMPHIGSTELQAIMMTFAPEEYRNALEWWREKEWRKA